MPYQRKQQAKQQHSDSPFQVTKTHKYLNLQYRQSYDSKSKKQNELIEKLTKKVNALEGKLAVPETVNFWKEKQMTSRHILEDHTSSCQVWKKKKRKI